jgi:LysM repeat protein
MDDAGRFFNCCYPKRPAERSILNLELAGPGFYVRHMKRIFPFFAAVLIAVPTVAKAEDAATEERLNKLAAQIADLQAVQDSQRKHLDELSREIGTMQQQLNKPSPNYASADDLKQIADKIQEVDRKRQQDSENVADELRKLGRTLTAKPPRIKHTPEPAPSGNDAPAPSPKEKDHMEYTVQSGDTLMAIVQAYREKGVKVTLSKVLNANPGLKPETMKVGQKIVIPVPQ